MRASTNPEIKKLLGNATEIGSILYQYQHSEKYVLEAIRDYIRGEIKEEREPLLFDSPPFSNVNISIFNQNFIDEVFKTPNPQVLNYLKKREIFSVVHGVGITDNNLLDMLSAKNVADISLIKSIDILTELYEDDKERSENILETALDLALKEKNPVLF